MIIKSAGKSAGFVALLGSMRWELETTLDLDRGVPLHSHEEAWAEMAGKKEHDDDRHDWHEGDTRHDLHSAICTLRGWQGAPKESREVRIGLGGGHFSLTIERAGRGVVGGRPAVRYDGIAAEESHFSIWLSDDAARVRSQAMISRPQFLPRAKAGPMIGRVDDAKGEFRRVEVLTGPGRRRRWSADEKARIVAETLAPGARVSEVARWWQICSQQVFGWRRAMRQGAHDPRVARQGLHRDDAALLRFGFAEPPAVPAALEAHRAEFSIDIAETSFFLGRTTGTGGAVTGSRAPAAAQCQDRADRGLSCRVRPSVASTLSRSHCGVQPLQLNACVGGGELPIGLGVVVVAASLPGGDFLDQGLLVRDAPIETLRRQDAEFGFSHIQPTAVFGCVVPLEPFDQPACLGGGEGLVE